MALLNKSISAIATAVLMAASSAATYFFCDNKHQKEISDLEQEIKKMKDTERHAFITQRISEQMGDVALEQKLVSDRQRERAEQQTEVAESERRKAEMERGIAVRAQYEAIEKAHEADSMRDISVMQQKIAQRHMIEAMNARAQADTSFYRFLGRSLAQMALTQSGTQNREVVPLLAYASYYYTSEYKGDVYQQDIFTALLNNSSSAQVDITKVSGGVRSISRYNDSFIAVSDYGEIMEISPRQEDSGDKGAYTTRKLVNDPEFNFRQICILDNTAFAIDNGGYLVKVPLNGNQIYTPIFIPQSGRAKDTWSHLITTPDGRLIAAGQHQVCLIDRTGTRVMRAYYSSKPISCIAYINNKVYLFLDDRQIDILSPNLAFQQSEALDANELTGKVTAYHYAEKQHYHILGLDNGTIYVYDDNGNQLAYHTAHTSPITQIADYGWCLATASYDHTVRLWNLDEMSGYNAIVPAKVAYSSWPYAISATADGNTLIIGLANGNIQTLSISVAENAAATRRNITREFDPVTEWTYFVGPNVQYRTFKPTK